MVKVIWFTGLSGSGKSTIASALERITENTIVLDGDVLREGLCSDLGFSMDDRDENLRRAAHVAQLFYAQGISPVVAFISPLQRHRDFARSLIPEGDFVEVYVGTPLEVCEARDVKGLYKRARAGEIPDFTGISSPYEIPKNPGLRLDTLEMTAQELAMLVADYCGLHKKS
jgi:adenylylsulfate kinase